MFLLPEWPVQMCSFRISLIISSDDVAMQHPPQSERTICIIIIIAIIDRPSSWFPIHLSMTYLYQFQGFHVSLWLLAKGHNKSFICLPSILHLNLFHSLSSLFPVLALLFSSPSRCLPREITSFWVVGNFCNRLAGHPEASGANHVCLRFNNYSFLLQTARTQRDR